MAAYTDWDTWVQIFRPNPKKGFGSHSSDHVIFCYDDTEPFFMSWQGT